MPNPAAPLVDVIIPVHTPARPVDRAVASALAGGLPAGPGGVQVTVVCHNVDPALIRERLDTADRDRVELVAFRDDTRNPAGARNLGIERTRAPWLSFLDSDDTLDPGALARWLEIGRRRGSAAVLARVSREGGAVVRTPVTRPWRSRDLDAVADRLAYRTRVSGLFRTEAIRRLGLRFPVAYATGEDQSFSLRLHAEAGRIDYARGRPGYHLRDDATDRITDAASPLAEVLQAFTDLAASPWLRSRPLALRRGYAVKVLRLHVFDEVTARTRRGSWSAQDAAAARDAVRILLAEAPGAERALCRADRDLVDLLARGETDRAAVTRAAEARRRFGTPATLVPRELSRLLHRDGSLRFMAAAALMG
ncbi:hypothetical protein AUQ48_00225 [Kocuria flava]|uniref:Glycosyltransferase 2-like domain-containing protein n=1 Tax=Kocuria flava TaxID=446860 RepID=A0A2N4SYE7_9MICC|nr:glycosyltransferase family A protein [Kocuria flava]PLC10966.1 hypothetical protein AUQ48_00225 [Kocuria flava]